MAITFALASRTQYALSYVLTQDGGAGNNVTITSADMRADLVAAGLGGPLHEFLAQFPRTAPATSGAEARRLLLAGDTTTPNLQNIAHCRSWIVPRGGVVLDWRVDGVAAVGTTEIGLQFVSALVAGDALAYIQFSHTLDR